MTLAGSPNQIQQEIQRNCSRDSADTMASSGTNEDYDDNMDDRMVDCEHIQQQTFFTELEPVVNPVPIYVQKRKNILLWLQHYAYHLNLTRSCLSLCHTLTDIYYHNNIYVSSESKITLCSLLIISSKLCDYKILFTNYIADLCDLNQADLNAKELQVCMKLGFEFNRDTYAGSVDSVIEDLKKELPIYQENQETYIILRMMHRIAQKLYTEVYEWQHNKWDILYALQYYLSIKNKITLELQNKIQQQRQKLAQQKPSIDFTFQIQAYVREWSQKEKQIRELYKNRTTLDKYTNYKEFAIRYFK